MKNSLFSADAVNKSNKIYSLFNLPFTGRRVMRTAGILFLNNVIKCFCKDLETNMLFKGPEYENTYCGR